MAYLTGFADEAANDIEDQIKATKALGWSWIESRAVSGTNIHDLSDEDFDKTYAALEGSGVGVNCFGSAVANWASQITDPFENTIAQIERAIPRMHRLNCKMIRIMSFAVLKEDDKPVADQMEEERFKRLREIQKRFSDAGIVPVHENCMNYGGMGAQYTLKMIENVPGLKLVFDTGNPVFSADHAKGEPYPRQNAFDFYKAVKEHIAYVHIKDGVWSEGKSTFSFPGEGDGFVPEIVKDLLDSGYDGGFSMEPHMKVVYHEESSDDDKTEARIENYIEYGKRFMKIMEDAGHPWSAETESKPEAALALS